MEHCDQAQHHQSLPRRRPGALPQALRELAEPVERALAQVRAVVEHPFHIVKNESIRICGVLATGGAISDKLAG